MITSLTLVFIFISLELIAFEQTIFIYGCYHSEYGFREDGRYNSVNQPPAPPPLREIAARSKQRREANDNQEDDELSKLQDKWKVDQFGDNLPKFRQVTTISRNGRPPDELDDDPFNITSNNLFVKIQIVDCLYAHNKIRRLYGLEDFRWSNIMSYGAETWALTLAERGKGQVHSPQPDRYDLHYGENIWGMDGQKRIQNCSNAVSSWYR